MKHDILYLTQQIQMLQQELERQREAEQVNKTLSETDKTIKEVLAEATANDWSEQLMSMSIAEMIARATGKTGKKVTGKGSRLTADQVETAKQHILDSITNNPPNRSSRDLREYVGEQVPEVSWTAARLNHILSQMVEAGAIRESKQPRPNPSLYSLPLGRLYSQPTKPSKKKGKRA